MPVNAVGWSITRAQLMLRRNGTAAGTSTVHNRNAGADWKPAATSLATQAINVTTIPTTNTWVNVPMNKVANSTHGQKMSLVVTT